MSSNASTKIGHALARVFGIKLDYRDETGTGKEGLSRGESVFSVASADTYLEEEPTAGQWIAEITPSGRDVLQYLYSLAPFTHWLHRYNLQWFIGDLVAGKHLFLPRLSPWESACILGGSEVNCGIC